jgi:hypothetical protein
MSNKELILEGLRTLLLFGMMTTILITWFFL